MADKSWKAFERRIATAFGGQRRGCDFRGPHGGKSDVIVPGFSVECKLLGQPKWSGLLAAIRQVEASAAPNEIPVAVIKKKFANDEDTLCIMRLSSFLEWFGGGRES